MGGQHIGHLLWTDLTVPNADETRAFYEAVIGWTSHPVKMEDRTDFSMAAIGEPQVKTDQEQRVVAGICNKVGDLSDFPSQWILYFGVEDLEASTKKTEELGGKILTKIFKMGNSKYTVIQDPAGAVCGLFEFHPHTV